MPRFRPLPSLWCLALLVLVTSAPAASQDGPPPRPDSEIGRLILTLQTTDGRPIVGTNVVVRTRAGGSEPGGTLRTDENGNASVPGDAFPEGTDVTVGVEVRYGSYSSITGSYTFLNTDRKLYVRTPTFTLTDDPDRACPRAPLGSVEVSDLFAGCATSETFQWAGQVDLPTKVELDIDASCDPFRDWTPDRAQASDAISGRLYAPKETNGEPVDLEDSPFRPDAFLDPIPLRFLSGDQNPGQYEPEEIFANCEIELTDAELPETAIYALHGYNIDFKDGAWGIRGTTALPFLPRRNLGAALGLDFYPGGDFSSTLAVNADVTTSFPWPALGDASAFFGVGPRAYIQSFDNGMQSSSSTEFGAGAVSGMTYGLGPVSLYGDVGFDYVYSTFVPVTHFGVGFAFSRD